MNFFFLRYFGIGYEAQWYDNDGTAEHLPVGGNFFLRYPICAWNLAPYIFVGGGAAWDGDCVGYGNVGAGLEYRFTDHIGAFVDGRYFYGNKDFGNAANLRAGIAVRVLNSLKPSNHKRAKSSCENTEGEILRCFSLPGCHALSSSSI